jgi:hypothetical protein
MPQVLEDVSDLIYEQDGDPPHFQNEVTSYLDVLPRLIVASGVPAL